MTGPNQFKEALSDLPARWMKCSTSDGEYFEGQNVQIPDHMSVTKSESSDSEDWSQHPFVH